MHTALHSLSNASRRISDVRVMRPSRSISQTCIILRFCSICLTQRPPRPASCATHPNMWPPSLLQSKKIETVPNLIFSDANLSSLNFQILATARTQIAAREIVLWTTPSEPPKALQASECSELLDPMRASCLILAQHQPGKFKQW